MRGVKWKYRGDCVHHYNAALSRFIVRSSLARISGKLAKAMGLHMMVSQTLQIAASIALLPLISQSAIAPAGSREARHRTQYSSHKPILTLRVSRWAVM